MANRIAEAFVRMEAQIKDRIEKGLVKAQQVADLSKTLNMDIAEHARFQTLKSLAVANGKLTAEEGQTVYVALGNTVSVFNKQPVHVKSVLTSLFGELLKARM